MRIAWILSAAGATGDATNLHSTLASYRYRAAIPMTALRARGHTCTWHGLRAGEAIDARHPALREADVVVFGKNHGEQAEVVGLLEHARSAGVATVVDMCDDYFGTGQRHEPYYRTLAKLAHAVTASSERLADAIEQATGIEAAIVRDPYEGPPGAPRWAPDVRNVKAVWFGTPFNLEALLAEAFELPGKIRDYTLHVDVLTSVSEGLEDAFQKLNARSGGKLTLAFREWSLERNWAALADADLALLPVKQERFFLAKGANRLVETLRAGRFAIAHALPAYAEFKPWTWTGDLAEGIEWALDHPREVVERITAGQQYVDHNYSPAAIAREWEDALEDAISLRASRQI